MFDRRYARPEDFTGERTHFHLGVLRPLTAIVLVVRVLPLLVVGLVAVFIGTGAAGAPGWLAALMAIATFVLLGLLEATYRGHRAQHWLIYLLS
jgi:hypothetical protein